LGRRDGVDDTLQIRQDLVAEVGSQGREIQPFFLTIELDQLLVDLADLSRQFSVACRWRT